LEFAEAFRGALISSATNTGSLRELGAPVLSGHRGTASNHQHAHYLPASSDGESIDALCIWLPTGCTALEYAALSAEHQIYGRGPLRGGFLALPEGTVEPVIACHWKTATPFVLDRFPKFRGAGVKRLIDAPEDQLALALERRGLPKAMISVAPSTRRFSVARARDTRPLLAYEAKLSFSVSLAGPIALGRLAHFGLGHFVPQEIWSS
jgi:CRISPR-associated protein Csb2